MVVVNGMRNVHGLKEDARHCEDLLTLPFQFPAKTGKRWVANNDVIKQFNIEYLSRLYQVKRRVSVFQGCLRPA
jgi:hypothetical protein